MTRSGLRLGHLALAVVGAHQLTERQLERNWLDGLSALRHANLSHVRKVSPWGAQYAPRVWAELLALPIWDDLTHLEVRAAGDTAGPLFDMIRSGGCPALRSVVSADRQELTALNGLLSATGRLGLETLGLTDGWEVPWDEILAAGTVSDLSITSHRSPSRFLGALRRIGGGRLKRLRLTLNDLDPNWENVRDHPVFAQLDSFELVIEQPTPVGIEALVQWPLLDRVHRIWLSSAPHQ